MRAFQVLLAAGAIVASAGGGEVLADSLAGYEIGISTLTFGSEYAGNHTYTLNHDNITQNFSGVRAGNFNDNIISNPNVNSGTPRDLFLMYCIDLTHTISLNTTYNAEVNLDGYIVSHVNAGPSGSGAVTTTATSGILVNAGKIAYLMKTEAAAIYTSEGNDTKDKQQVGLQAAIWELVYGVNFTSLNTDAVVVANYNYYLSLVASGDFSSHTNDVLWINTKNVSNGVYRQAQVGYLVGAEGPEPVIPVPSTLTMLFSLMGTGLLARYGKRCFKGNQAAA